MNNPGCQPRDKTCHNPAALRTNHDHRRSSGDSAMKKSKKQKIKNEKQKANSKEMINP
jgi:hypothetical protein